MHRLKSMGGRHSVKALMQIPLGLIQAGLVSFFTGSQAGGCWSPIIQHREWEVLCYYRLQVSRGSAEGPLVTSDFQGALCSLKSSPSQALGQYLLSGFSMQILTFSVLGNKEDGRNRGLCFQVNCVSKEEKNLLNICIYFNIPYKIVYICIYKFIFF